MKDGQTDRQMDGQTDRRMDRQTDRHTDRQTDKQTERRTDRLTDREIDEWTDRRTNKQIKERTNSQYLERQPPQPQLGFIPILYPGGIGIWRCWFLWREENQRTWRKTLGARRESTSNSTHIRLLPNRHRMFRFRTGV